jgi:hypothetical protein
MPNIVESNLTTPVQDEGEDARAPVLVREIKNRTAARNMNRKIIAVSPSAQCVFRSMDDPVGGMATTLPSEL